MVSGPTFWSGVAAVQLTPSGEVIVTAVTLSTLAWERLVVFLPTAMNLPFPKATSLSSGPCTGYRSGQVDAAGAGCDGGPRLADLSIGRFFDVIVAHRDEEACAEGDAVQDAVLP